MYRGKAEREGEGKEETESDKSGHSALSEVARGFLPAICLMA